ncbi:MAG: DUF6775 family putative metallopeptidase [candidate division WOR-3 bacterium]
MKKIHLYKVNYEGVNFIEIKEFFEREGFEVFLEEDPLLKLEGEELNKKAEYLAKIRVLDPLKRYLNENPFPVEIDYERRNLKNLKRKKGIVYDGLKFLKIYKEFISPLQRDLESSFTIFFTDQLLATYSDRWHLRVILFSFPVLISIPGVIYAPAKDRDYYIAKSLKSLPKYKDYYLIEGDERLNRILISYVIQGIFFYDSILKRRDFLFCEDKNCILYNSHFQREVINAQYNLSFCELHKNEWDKIIKY